MIQLIVFGGIAFCVFAMMFYQSYRDKHRWNRISAGMSLFGAREDIPPLELDGVTYDPHERRVLVLWGDGKQSPFETVSDALRRIEKQSRGNTAKADAARIFAWDGETWTQRR